MLRTPHFFAAAALGLGIYAMAASPSIGTVTTRGETRIDNYEVQGSGTLFDGSVIETGLSHADLRLANNGAVVILYASSRGTLHTDHFLLERGSIRLSSSNSFNVQADSLVVAPVGDSSGVVTVKDSNSVVVEAQEGTLEVRDAAGTRIAQVQPRSPMSFTSTGNLSSAITVSSAVPSRNNHQELPTVDANMIPSVRALSGVSTQTSSQLGGAFSRPRPDGGSGCPSGEVPGAGGGCCMQSQLEQCCPHRGGTGQPTCCPGLNFSKKQCGPSN